MDGHSEAFSDIKYFHNVLRQHMQGVEGFLIISLLQISQTMRYLKKIKNWLRFDRVAAISFVSPFLLGHGAQ